MMEYITIATGLAVGTLLGHWLTRRREKRGEKVIPFYLSVAETFLLAVGGRVARNAYREVHRDRESS